MSRMNQVLTIKKPLGQTWLITETCTWSPVFSPKVDKSTWRSPLTCTGKSSCAVPKHTTSYCFIGSLTRVRSEGFLLQLRHRPGQARVGQNFGSGEFGTVVGGGEFGGGPQASDLLVLPLLLENRHDPGKLRGR